MTTARHKPVESPDAVPFPFKEVPDPQNSLLLLDPVERLFTVTSAYNDEQDTEQEKEKLYPTDPVPARQALIETLWVKFARVVDVWENILEESSEDLSSLPREA